jgi:hypothetical protein
MGGILLACLIALAGLTAIERHEAEALFAKRDILVRRWREGHS